MLYFAYGSNLNHFQMKKDARTLNISRNLKSKTLDLRSEANMVLQI